VELTALLNKPYFGLLCDNSVVRCCDTTNKFQCYLTKSDERRLEAFHMNCQRWILGIRWFHFVTNVSVTSQTGEEDMASRIRWRRLSVFGHVHRLPEATPAHSALRLAVDTRAGYRPDNRPEWKRRRGRPCRAWMEQIEEDSGLNVNDAWRIAHDHRCWTALRPVAGQAVQ